MAIVTKHILFVSMLLLYATSHLSSTRLMIIRNAIFDAPTIGDSYPDRISQVSCICRCYQTSQCVTMNYDGDNETCTLFSISIDQGQLRTANASERHLVMSFASFTNRDPSPAFVTSSPFENKDTSTSVTSGLNETRCYPQNTTLFSFTTTPTTYQRRTYNYTAMSTNLLTLEFGFQAKNQAKAWHLDDVSVIDLNASMNTNILINGNFENGTLIGWQRTCSNTNCLGSTGGFISQTSCRTGLFCYTGACQDDYDFLRQSFLVQVGRMYMLSFWLFTDGHAAQKAYVTLN